jgi:hypothetical protein
VRNYLSHIVFYFLDFVGSTINFSCSLVHKYPKLELGISFLTRQYKRTYSHENTQQVNRRRKLHKDGNDKFEEAKDSL